VAPLVDAVDIFRRMTAICSWPALASLEDDLIRDSVGDSKAADGHNDNGE
jgi:hypothetical protein